MATDLRDRYRGTLLGLALGDAFGTTLEFQAGPFLTSPAANIEYASTRLGTDTSKASDAEAKLHASQSGWHHSMTGGGPFNLPAGFFTDDTSLALCLCESFILARGQFDPRDHLRRFSEWYRNGHWGSTGECFDIGVGTRLAIQAGEKDRSDCFPASSSNDARCGNGSLMRLAPCPLAFFPCSRPDDARALAECVRVSGQSSRTTHGHRMCVDACRYFAALLIGCFQGATKEQLLPRSGTPFEPRGLEGIWTREPLHEEIAAIAAGSYRDAEPPEINGRGAVTTTLRAVLWAFNRSATFYTGLLYVVNIGDDADTTAAIYGQLAGAFYGAQGLPGDLIAQVLLAPYIETCADELYDIASTQDEVVRSQTPSERFLGMHAAFLWLQNAHRPILRKCNPCPRMYRRMDELDADIEQIQYEFQKVCACDVPYTIVDKRAVPDTDTRIPVDCVNPHDTLDSASASEAAGGEQGTERKVLNVNIGDECRDILWNVFVRILENDRARITSRVA